MDRFGLQVPSVVIKPSWTCSTASLFFNVVPTSSLSTPGRLLGQLILFHPLGVDRRDVMTPGALER